MISTNKSYSVHFDYFISFFYLKGNLVDMYELGKKSSFTEFNSHLN